MILIFKLIIMFVIGWLVGYISNSLITSNIRSEEIAAAFERGKTFERMRISKAIDEKFGSGPINK